MRSHRQNDGDQEDGDELQQGSVWDTRAFVKMKGAANVISEKTSIPFKVVIPIAALLIACTMKISGGINKIEIAISRSWTVDSMDRWARAFQRENPSIKVPDAREIFDTREKPIKLIEY